MSELIHHLDLRARTRVRAIFKNIQERASYPTQGEECPGCGLLYELNPSCKVHPGLCCLCVDIAAKLERKVISHAKETI